MKTLSADAFQGRGPGTDGGVKAAEYIASQLKSSGVKAINKAGYFQNVNLVGVKADPRNSLHIVDSEGRDTSFAFGEDFVTTTGAQTADVSLESDLVFVGYGVDAPQYKWNDYKGDPSAYKGKILVILVNDPPATSDEPDLFGGKALTYFGRWTYKYEEAARTRGGGRYTRSHDRIRRLWMECSQDVERQLAVRDRPRTE